MATPFQVFHSKEVTIFFTTGRQPAKAILGFTDEIGLNATLAAGGGIPKRNIFVPWTAVESLEIVALGD